MHLEELSIDYISCIFDFLTLDQILELCLSSKKLFSLWPKFSPCEKTKHWALSKPDSFDTGSQYLLHQHELQHLPIHSCEHADNVLYKTTSLRCLAIRLRKFRTIYQYYQRLIYSKYASKSVHQELRWKIVNRMALKPWLCDYTGYKTGSWSHCTSIGQHILWFKKPSDFTPKMLYDIHSFAQEYNRQQTNALFHFFLEVHRDLEKNMIGFLLRCRNNNKVKMDFFAVK